MSGSQKQPWSDDPNAPKIPYRLYFDEKANIAGYLVSSVLYGILIVLFFRCMGALVDPRHSRRGPIKWGLISYTALMFSLVTIQTAARLKIVSSSYIDNRKFPGVGHVLPPGPLAYQIFVSTEAIAIVPTVIFTLNNWLADGLLLYRCYAIYCRNLWVIVFPCLMYLGSLAMGIVFVYQNVIPDLNTTPWSGVPYYTISLSFNIILTLMIVIRLILQARDTRTALGMTRISGLYKAVVTMLIESCVLYALSSLLVIGPWGANSPITNFFLPILNQTQVIAPLFIIQRVANRSALTSETAVSGRIASFKARGPGRSADDSDTLSGGDPTSLADRHGSSLREFGDSAETMTDSRQDKV